MRRVLTVACSLAAIAAFATLAFSADDLAEAVKERRHLMKDIVRPGAKLGGDMLKGIVPFDAGKAATAMHDISGVPDKYVTLFPKGTEHGAIADSEAAPKIWDDFDGFKALAQKLKDASLKAEAAAGDGEEAFKSAFGDMTKVCKDCHQTYRVKKQQ